MLQWYQLKTSILEDFLSIFDPFSLENRWMNPATHLNLVFIACRRYETKHDFAGPPCPFHVFNMITDASLVQLDGQIFGAKPTAKTKGGE
jgi:hypothetical protein